MRTVSIKKRSYLRSINQAIPMKDSVMKEYELEEQYDNLSDEELEARLGIFFAEQRELLGSASISEECIPIAEAYQKSIKHLEELYAKKKSRINA